MTTRVQVAGAAAVRVTWRTMVWMWLGLGTGCAPAQETAADGPLRRLVTGEVTWSVAYDADAVAAGAVNCTYTRSYTATEDRSAPWTCHACAEVFAATMSMSTSDQACYRGLTGQDPDVEERIGWDDATFYRALGTFGSLGPTADRTDGGDGSDGIAFHAEVPDVDSAFGGTATLTIDGALAVAEGPGDPWSGMTPPDVYTCGWHKQDPPPYEGPWEVEVGKQLPDGWFGDRCGQGVRLHDLAGSYTVVDLAAADCGPCQAMAAEEHAFLQDLRAEGVEVTTVTLLAPALSAPFETAEIGLLTAWQVAFGIADPVLGDRGWGVAMALSVWPESLAYPSWFVVSPSFEVIGVGQGFGDWEPMRTLIVDHIAAEDARDAGAP